MGYLYHINWLAGFLLSTVCHHIFVNFPRCFPSLSAFSTNRLKPDVVSCCSTIQCYREANWEVEMSCRCGVVCLLIFKVSMCFCIWMILDWLFDCVRLNTAIECDSNPVMIVGSQSLNMTLPPKSFSKIDWNQLPSTASEIPTKMITSAYFD